MRRTWTTFGIRSRTERARWPEVSLSALSLFVPKPSSQFAVLAHIVPDLSVDVRQRPQASGHERIDRHSVSHSARAPQAVRRQRRRSLDPLDANSGRNGRCWSLSLVGSRTAACSGHENRPGCCTRCRTVMAMPKLGGWPGGAGIRGLSLTWADTRWFASVRRAGHIRRRASLNECSRGRTAAPNCNPP